MDYLKKGRTEYNYFYYISIIATPFFLIAQSKITYIFFPKSQQVIGTNGKYKKDLSTILKSAGVLA